MAKIKRSQIATYIDVEPAEETPDYALLGLGITNAAIEYNPQTLEETYIHQDSGTTEVESYRPVMPLEITPDTSDEAFAFLDGLRKARAVLEDANTTIVNVWLYEDDVEGEYPAEQQTVSVQVESFGGEGGTSAKGTFTLNFIGDPVQGTFNPETATFTEESEGS